jgi:hypothetical protein
MSSIVHLPEQFKIVSGTAGIVTTNGGVTCDYVSLKNVNMAWIVLHFLQAAGHATVVNPRRATAVAPTGSVAIAHNAPHWLNTDIATTDTLVRGADGVTATLDVGVTNQLLVFQIDPAQMGDTYDVLGCVITTSGQGANFLCVVYNLETRYGQATPPAAITD